MEGETTTGRFDLHHKEKGISYFSGGFSFSEFFINLFNSAASSAAPTYTTVSTDAGIEPTRTIAKLALASKRFNHSARSHPRLAFSLYKSVANKKLRAVDEVKDF
jgi:hypothetical protein